MSTKRGGTDFTERSEKGATEECFTGQMTQRGPEGEGRLCPGHGARKPIHVGGTRRLDKPACMWESVVARGAWKGKLGELCGTWNGEIVDVVLIFMFEEGRNGSDRLTRTETKVA